MDFLAKEDILSQYDLLRGYYLGMLPAFLSLQSLRGEHIMYER